MNFLFPVLDLQITLRCNAHCLNCIKFCNMKQQTGLDYSDSDMTIDQIDKAINQIKSFERPNVFKSIFITGGEPVLHKQLEEIINKFINLQAEGYFTDLFINSNLKKEAPEPIRKYIINFSKPEDNKLIHNTVLIHPKDFCDSPKTYKTCTHYRKNRVVLNYLGYSLCCAGDAYIRLFNYEDLIVNHLPQSINDFPNMDKICVHCPFSNDTKIPLEKNAGCPVSDVYYIEARLNRKGRAITKRF